MGTVGSTLDGRHTATTQVPALDPIWLELSSNTDELCNPT